MIPLTQDVDTGSASYRELLPYREFLQLRKENVIRASDGRNVSIFFVMPRETDEMHQTERRGNRSLCHH